MTKTLLVCLTTFYGAQAIVTLPTVVVAGCKPCIIKKMSRMQAVPIAAVAPVEAFVAAPPLLVTGFEKADLTVKPVNDTYSDAVFIATLIGGVQVPFPIQFYQKSKLHSTGRGFPTKVSVLEYYQVLCPHNIFLGYICDSFANKDSSVPALYEVGSVTNNDLDIGVPITVFTMATKQKMVSQNDFEDCDLVAKQLYPDVKFKTLSPPVE